MGISRFRFGTVGPPMPGCEVKIAADGEIMVHSEMMFSGYYKAPEQTAEMFRDGWLLTGDIGERDEDGFLKITGRKKELIVTSTGKNISPALIENMLKEHHLISHALVYGEGKSYLVALITLNPAEAAEFLRANGSAAVSDNPGRFESIQRLVQKMIDEYRKKGAQVKRSETTLAGVRADRLSVEAKGVGGEIVLVTVADRDYMLGVQWRPPARAGLSDDVERFFKSFEVKRKPEPTKPADSGAKVP